MLRRMFFGTMFAMLLVYTTMLAFDVQTIESIHGIIRVPDDYSAIQQAINNANDGDNIFVGTGIYNEHVVVNRSISLTGENPATTVIDGDGFGTVVNVLSDNVAMSSFTIRNSGKGITEGLIDSSISINHSSSTKIENCVLTNSLFGILANHSSSCWISGNNISSNSLGGIAIEMFSNNAFVYGNYLAGSFWGIVIEFSNNSIICRNTLAENSRGIAIYLSSNDSICKNNITASNYAIELHATSNNTICLNNFINNVNQVESEKSVSVWDNSYPSGGNYWSDYNGTDNFWGQNQNLNGYDTIGDIPYVIDENNTDRYPLMNPWRECKPPITEFPDLNGDGKVNIMDIAAVALHFGEKFQDP